MRGGEIRASHACRFPFTPGESRGRENNTSRSCPQRGETSSAIIAASLFQFTSWATCWFYVPVAFIFFFSRLTCTHGPSRAVPPRIHFAAVLWSRSPSPPRLHSRKGMTMRMRWRNEGGKAWTPWPWRYRHRLQQPLLNTSVPHQFRWNREGAGQLERSFHRTLDLPASSKEGSARFASIFTWDMKPATYLRHGQMAIIFGQSWGDQERPSKLCKSSSSRHCCLIGLACTAFYSTSTCQKKGLGYCGRKYRQWFRPIQWYREQRTSKQLHLPLQTIRRFDFFLHRFCYVSTHTLYLDT